MTDPLRKALNTIGMDETLRAEFIAACHAVERSPEYQGTTVRDDITGPIIDALHERAGTLRKELSSGIVFDFHYRSKIARDFVMSIPEKPDHVWEPQTTRLLVSLSEGAANVVIGGAYFGDHAIPVAHELRNHGGICHAFEANAGQAAMLAHNARLNHLDNIRVNGVGLWRDTTSRLCLEGDDALAGTVAATDGQPAIPITTIDRYLDDEGIDRVDWIMVDIEGSELEALLGAERQLSLPPGRAPHLVFEVHGGRDDWSSGLQATEIYRYVTSFGYTVFAIRDMQSNIDLGGGPIELVPPETAYLAGPPHGFNMLAVKNRDVIANERFAICPGVSPKLLRHRDPALHSPAGGFPTER